MAEQLTKQQRDERQAEHAVALGRVCMTDDPVEFFASLAFLNDDGWEITATPRDAEFGVAEAVTANGGES